MREFYVLSSGRCGTKWLQSIWGKDKSAAIHHEPFARLDTNLVHVDGEYFREIRRPACRLIAQMVEVSRKTQVEVLGETTPSLRFAVKAIRSVSPEATIVHLVRDGREVVRSLMNRFHYKKGNPGARAHAPSGGIWAKRWENLTRFQRCCWFWMDANEMVTDFDVRVRFEDLLGDYGAFARLSALLGVTTFEGRWERMRGKKVNQSFRREFGPWTSWSDEESSQFDEICGVAMAEYGYELSRQGATT